VGFLDGERTQHVPKWQEAKSKTIGQIGEQANGWPMRGKRSLGKSRVLKRTVVVDGSKTSVSVEEPFWTAFKEIAAIKEVPIYALVSEIANAEGTVNLSSGIRVFVLNHYRAASGKLTGL
jgi:predicted DNA-binding ribbon-helix-helix protein